MARWYRNLLWAGSMLLVASCGGGGGGSNVTLTFENTTLAASAMSNEFSVVDAVAGFRFSSVPDAGLYISIEFSQSGVDSVNFSEAGDTAGQINVHLKSPNSLGAGVYRDSITVSVCYDETCDKQVRGSPTTLSVTYTVTDPPPPTTLSLDNNSFELRAGPGESARVVSVLATLSGPDAARIDIRLRPNSTDPVFTATEVVRLSDTQRRIDFYLADPDEVAIGSHTGIFYLDACYPGCFGYAGNGNQSVYISYAVSQFVQRTARKVQGNVNDVVWDAVAQKFYLSFPSTAASYGNSVAILDPLTGNITASVVAGSEPKRMAVSDDGSYLYVALGGANQVRRFKLPALTPDITINLGVNPSSGPRFADEIAVAPGQPKTLAVSFIEGHGLAIYDDSVRRNSILGEDGYFSLAGIAWGADASRLFAYNGSSVLYVTDVTPAGVSIKESHPSFLGNYYLDIHYANDLIYGDNGTVVDPVSGSRPGVFTAPGNVNIPQALIPEPAQNRVHMLSKNYDDPHAIRQLTAFDIDRYVPLRTVQIQLEDSNRFKLIQWNDSFAALSYEGNVYLLDGAARP